MNPFIVGIPAYVGCLFFGYLVREYSVGKLNAEQLGTLSVNMRPTRLRYLWSMLATLAVCVAAIISMPSLQKVWFLGFLTVVAVLTVGFEIHGWRTSGGSVLPRSFVVPFLISRAITHLGTFVLIGTVAATQLPGI
jgi:hypothetical protein